MTDETQMTLPPMMDQADFLKLKYETPTAKDLAAMFTEPHGAVKELEKALGRTVKVQEMMEIRIQTALHDAYYLGVKHGRIE